MIHRLIILSFTLFIIPQIAFTKCDFILQPHCFDESGYGIWVGVFIDRDICPNVPALTFDMGDGTILEQNQNVIRTKHIDYVYHRYEEPGTYTVWTKGGSFEVNIPSPGSSPPSLPPISYQLEKKERFYILTIDTDTSFTGQLNTFFDYNFTENPYVFLLENQLRVYYPTEIDVCVTYYEEETYNSDCSVGQVCETLTIDFEIDFKAAFDYSLAPSNYIINDASTIQFYNKTWGKIQHASWDFGDGHTSREIHPEHTFQAAGTYEVCLTATNAILQETSRTCQTVEIDCMDFFSVEPVADQEHTFQFTLLDKSLEGQAFQWGFGDEQHSEEKNPIHTYDPSTGNYTVCLILEDRLSRCLPSNQICQVVYLDVLDATFDYVQSSDGTRTFYYSSTAAHNIKNYYWDLGDGTTSQKEVIRHIYAQPGSYEVCLRVESFSNEIAESCQVIEIEYEPRSIYCMPSITIDYDTAKGGTLSIKSHIYDTILVDSTASFQLNLSQDDLYIPLPYTIDTTIYDYNATYGFFMIRDRFCLEASSIPDYCKPNRCGYQTLSYCISNFSMDQAEAELPIQFESLGDSPHEITDWKWDFGDGNSSKLPNPEHQYPFAQVPTNYEVCLQLTNEARSFHRTCKTITIEGLALISTNVEAPPLFTDLAIHLQATLIQSELQFQLQSPHNKAVQFQIFSMSGQLIRSEQRAKEERYRIPVSHLSPGIYLLEVEQDGQFVREKFVKY